MENQGFGVNQKAIGSSSVPKDCCYARAVTMQNFLISGLKFWDNFKAVYLVKSLNNFLVHSLLHLIPNPKKIQLRPYRNWSKTEADFYQNKCSQDCRRFDLTGVSSRQVSKYNFMGKQRAFFLGKLVAVCCKYSFSCLGLAQNKYWFPDKGGLDTAKYFNFQPILILLATINQNRTFDYLSFWKIYGVEFQISQWEVNYRDMQVNST